jgi:serine/threonine protein kinase/tetratricopeptide (TPR) repeat protein
MTATPESFERAAELFRLAVERPPAGRAAFLNAACGGDAVLRREVESLLEFDDEGFIETPAFVLAAGAFGVGVGGRVGPYRLVREVGRGGMGTVYEARRDDAEFEKRVAVKVVRAGLDTEDILRRFRHERQILATLDHPNIARLIDGGTTADGRPFLVMDYVEGVPLTRYCDEHQLPTAERLCLFLAACSAVQYAHQNLVIHRDLKPGNVLVTAEGVPKLLDFGIAKLLDPEAPGHEGHTVTQLGVMTPEYASPEQARGLPVTTATDVYSLGVLLYELLTGRRPYRITSRRPEEVARVICEQEPARPSTAVTLTEVVPRGDDNGGPESITPEAVGRARRQSVEKLRRGLSGDLDNIVLMALRKEPHRRYASVAQLADDIERHMNGLPVAARKDTLRYRVTKFVGRHRAGVAAAALGMLMLVGGAIAFARQARVVAAERDRARIEAAKAERINSFMQGVLSSADPSRQGREVKVAEVLDEAADRMESDLGGQPEVLAEARRAVGNTYRSLGLYDKAEPHLRAALEATRQFYGDAHPATAKCMSDVAYLLRMKGNVAEAEPLYRRAIELQHRQAPDGSRDLAETLVLFAEMLFLKGDTKASETLAQESLVMSKRFLGEPNEVEARALNSIGLAREYEGDLGGAQERYRQAVDIYRRLPGRPRFELAAALMNLGTNLTTQGKYPEAENALGESVGLFQTLLGDSHPLFAMSLIHIGRLYLLKGDEALAEEKLRRALDIQRRALPQGHADLPQSLSTLGLVLTRKGNPADGETYLREALDIRRKVLPEGHWLIANVESQLGECLTAQKLYAKAEPLLTRGYDGLKSALGERHPRTTEAHQRLSRLREAWGKPDAGRRPPGSAAAGQAIRARAPAAY